MIDDESLDDLADEISDFTPSAPNLESTTHRSSTVESDWKEWEFPNFRNPSSTFYI